MGQKHVHAELIKAWADGAAIEYLRFEDHDWLPASTPSWDGICEYRIKPEPPAKVYPVTGMKECELFSAYFNGGNVSRHEEILAYRRIANAALLHAIDSGQLVEPASLSTFDIEAACIRHNASVAERSKRDMAVAQAVGDAANKMLRQNGYVVSFTSDLAHIIATVKDSK